MNLNPIRQNMNEVEIGNKTILFSYKTPVAYHDEFGNYKTRKRWSVTTSRHINQWLRSYNIDPVTTEEVDQEILDNLLNEGK